MKDRLSLLDYLTLAVFAVQAAFALHIAFNGPTTPMPMHWNSAFQVDRWGSRVEFATVLGGMTLIGFIVTAGLGLGALRAVSEGDPSRGRSLRIGQGVTLFVFAVTGLLISWTGLGNATAETGPVVTMAGVSLILLVLGAFLGRVAPNPLVGVRTPWSYKSRLAWDRSNRLAGRLFFLLGLVGLVAAPLSPQPLGALSLTAGALIVAALSVFESWRVWRSDPDRRPF
ncbi:SdpI family protein [Brevundimonas sp. SL130]|uniref:SdpI family protein n=1 Tax=Brevundimonas sp. SL130 TaxID=2995143 RepID=UPI00226CD7DB|nr:SdpI family protein [Brevundimonas sp. SL130]WAC60958.1 SdpI family protein [Brevundimonas sp. SL130]